MSRRKALTDISVAELKPKSARYTVPDPLLPGHYLRVTPTGNKSFVAVAVDPSGKQIWATIGSPQLYTVEQSRERAREAIKAIKGGEGTGPQTFAEVSSQWLKRHVIGRGLRSRPELERLLARHILPKWAGRDFASIKRSDVTELMDHVEDKHGTRQADHVLSVMSSISNWYAARHNTYSSPIVRGMKRQKMKEQARDRILSDHEIRRLWETADGIYGDFCKIALLTAQRREKLVTMKWKDIEDGVWKIPSEDREKGNAGELALSTLALSIINDRPCIASNPYVFAAARGRNPFSGYSKAKRALDRKLQIAPWVFHDLRRTSRSLLARAGISSEHAERVMGHVVAGVERTYNRFAYDAEKGKAVEALANLVERILNPSENVTELKRQG